MKDFKISAQRHGQRLGQFINNAISDYLIDNNRELSDNEVANALYYMSDDTLESILNRYANVLNAKKDMDGLGRSEV